MPLGQPLATPESPLPRLQSGLVRRRSETPLCSRSPLARSLALGRSWRRHCRPRCYVWYADARPSPRGWEARHSLNPTASKGDGLLQPQQRRKELPSRTQLGWGEGTTHPGTRSLKRLCRPRDHPPRLRANGQGVSLAPLDQGYRHANCWLRAWQLMQKPHAPQVLSIRGAGGGEEMK